MKSKKQTLFRAVALAAVTLLFVSCDALGGGGGSGGGAEYFESGGQPILSGGTPRVQELHLAEAGSNLVEVATDSNGRSGAVDVTNLASGYVGARVNASTDAVFRVTNTDTGQGYDYSLATNGEWCFYPISYGSGNYQFSIYLHKGGTEYEDFLTHHTGVSVSDEKGAFLVQNRVVDYNANSAVVSLAFELTADCADDMEAIRQIFWWITTNIEYDTDKANNIASYGDKYVPDLDQILSIKRGICYDYAAMAAAMLRANGIPTRMVFGNVNDGEGGTIYHAWNEVWTDQTGWIAVKFEVKGGEWSRVDTTFAAADSSIASFVGDGSNYYETSIH